MNCVLKRELYMRGCLCSQKTAPFRVRLPAGQAGMNNGRSVFRFWKPRALARGASLLCMLLFLIFSPCSHAQAYTREEQDRQVSMMNYPAYQGSESAVAAFLEEKRMKEWEDQIARDRVELENRNNNDDVKPKYDNLKDRYENDDAFNMGVNFTIVALIMAFILSLFAGFVGLSQKALWFFMGVVVAVNVLWFLFLQTFLGAVSSLVTSFIIGLICFFIVQFNSHQNEV